MLRKRSAITRPLEERDAETESYETGHYEVGSSPRKYWRWATLLTKRAADNSVSHVTAIIVCAEVYTFECVVVCFGDAGQLVEDQHICGPLLTFAEDPSKQAPRRQLSSDPWPRNPRPTRYQHGGFLTERKPFPNGAEIVKVGLLRKGPKLVTMRLHFSDGSTVGKLDEAASYVPDAESKVLEINPKEESLGFMVLNCFRAI
ncbi:hypothetical protein B0H67DRAFT_570157 [Lasiosphaeris hirsuta]|uniref:Uncharacterized protein n=1 Tax=Lasiosphaeris hirsuta TaxID=260670 RepID=A0AA40B0C1_9PEZI|nr:hypothetical protein B0H67DRAFT_570157 [Lasiosphaeris hirsuta]